MRTIPWSTKRRFSVNSYYTEGLPRWPGDAELPDRSPWTPWPEYLLKGASALLACAAWLTLWVGLRNSAVDQRALDDLEAGGRAFLGVFLYLPLYLLTAVVVIAAALSLSPRPRTLAPAVALVSTAFALSAWTMLWRDLWGARPDLPQHSLIATGLSLVSCLPLALALAIGSRQR